jgi:hypothetical protein
MALVQRRITPDELAERLAKSKKVYEKVSSGDYERGNIVASDIVSDVNIPTMNEQVIQTEPIPQHIKEQPQPITVEKIQQSKLPDAIKKAMIEHPIPQISINDGLDINLMAKAKKLMEQDETLLTKTRNKSSTTVQKQIKDIELSQINEDKLEKIIENVVRKVLDEKLTQILSANQLQTINENLVLKVGDSIFSGKITKVKTSK